MKVFIVVLMAILLPLQAAWSAAAVFCQHESRTAWHWGHHQHVTDAACQQSSFNHDVNNKNVDRTDNTDLSKLSIQQLQNPDLKKDNKSHTFTLVNHSDHLTGNQPGLNPNPQAILMQPCLQDHLAVRQSLSPVLYQSPVLEQPKPPVWPA